VIRRNKKRERTDPLEKEMKNHSSAEKGGEERGLMMLVKLSWRCEDMRRWQCRNQFRGADGQYDDD